VAEFGVPPMALLTILREMVAIRLFESSFTGLSGEML
jgi:hypothetical protein